MAEDYNEIHVLVANCLLEPVPGIRKIFQVLLQIKLLTNLS